MARPLFRPSYSIRLTDLAVYQAIVQQYQFGVNVIFGVSPVQAAANWGAPVVLNPTDADYQALPGVFVQTALANVLGVPILTTDSGGTINLAIPYVDLNGVSWSQVDWEWQADVQIFQVGVPGVPVGTFHTQLVTWIGDGTSGRLIPTTFPLDQGKTIVLVFPTTSFQPTFRATGMVNSVCNQSVTTDGITTMTAAGFTVTDHSPINCRVNTNLLQFFALIFNDNTTDNRCMRIGTYTPKGFINNNGTFTAGSPIVLVGLNAYSPFDVGRQFVIGITTYTITAVAPTQLTISPPSLVNGVNTIQSNPNGGTVDAGVPIAGLFIFGNDCVMRSDVFPPGDAGVVFFDVPYPVTNLVTSMAGSIFTVGTDNLLINTNLTYWYVVIAKAGKTVLTNCFKFFKGTGVPVGDVRIPIPFTPQFVLSKAFITTGNNGAIWRSVLNVGVGSQKWSGGSGFVANGGIEAMGAGFTDIGQIGAPNGVDVYGFAFQGADTPVLTPPTYIPLPHPPPPNEPVPPPNSPKPRGGPIPPPAIPPGGGGQACRIVSVPVVQ